MKRLFQDYFLNMQWGPYAGILFAGLLLYYFPNDSNSTPPTFCPAGVGHQALPLIHRRPTMTIATFNAEWLFDGIKDPYRSFNTADAHIHNVGHWLQGLNADLLNVIEVEDCRVLSRIQREFLPDTASYVARSKDTATKQTLGLLTKIPLQVPGVMRSESRVSYPATGSKCGYSGKQKTSGVSKHWFGIIQTQAVGEILVVGVHLKARPNHPKSCSKREAQAHVVVDIIKQHGQGRHVILMGDFNDFDRTVLDASSNVPTSFVLDLFKNKLSLINVLSFVDNVKDRWTWRDRGTQWPDSALDHILISEKLVRHVEAVWVDRNASWSDHRPLALRFRWQTQ